MEIQPLIDAEQDSRTEGEVYAEVVSHRGLLGANKPSSLLNCCVGLCFTCGFEAQPVPDLPTGEADTTETAIEETNKVIC